MLLGCLNSLTVLLLISSQTTLALMNDFNLPLESLAASANAYAAAHGVQVEKKDSDGKSYFECAPISLLPNAYPKEAFHQAQILAPHFNLLVDRISRDADFLQDTLGGGVSQADPYTAKLLQLYNKIYVQDKNKHALAADSMGIQRSDYMLNKGKIQQVELNTIASSFAGLSTQVAGLHAFLLKRYPEKVQEFLQIAKAKVLSKDTAARNTDDHVPTNPALDRLPLAMNVAVQRYQERFSPEKQLAVVFVVQPGETNTVDQRMLELQLFQNHNVPVLRKSLAELQAQGKIDQDSGALFVETYEIALVYYRAGYAPTDYPDGLDGVEWQARATLETSRATKCPSLGYHLAGTKKVQQTLARPGALERFFPDEPDAVQAMRQAFAGLYSLGEDANEQDLDTVSQILNKKGASAMFVLKPQREGGGYNYYGDQLETKLRELTTTPENGSGLPTLDAKLGEFILMERLFPPQQKAVLLRAGKIEGSGDSISELGCFGTVVASATGDVVHNEYAGFLLRTKFANVDEGGVASGFATLSSPYLCL